MARTVVTYDGGTWDVAGAAPTSLPVPAPVASVFGRTGAVVAVNGDYAGVVAAFLSGATQVSRYVGATASGAPVAGTFAKGDFVIAQDGHLLVCTAAGTPGTWADVGASAGVSSLAKSGSTALTGAVTLSQGSNVTLTQSGNDIAIASTGGGGTTEYDYAEATSTVTISGTSHSSPTTVIDGNSVSYDGSTRIKIEIFAPAVQQQNAAHAYMLLFEDSTELGIIGDVDNPTSGTMDAPVYGFRFRTPSAGSHTYHWKAYKTGGGGSFVLCGSGGADTFLPAVMRITAA